MSKSLEITNYNIKYVSSIEISDYPMESSSNHYYCLITLKDNLIIETIYNKDIIYYNFKHLLSDKDKEKLCPTKKIYNENYFTRLWNALLNK